ncbi:AbrB/MazE/SpoVT family DNA-binding domain-containing protein [Candidatus Woesearchaeota archaeon]|nr:AbrB/MazE/SpoVT family DNA-binding domain-containing protein [Candidatus Woesearchaeota archaeon]
MKRRVIQIANSTQLISLPRKWTLQYNIKKGDELEVEEDGNKITVSTEKAQESKNIEVDITGLDRDSFMFLIRVLYIRGYDEIKLIFNEPTVDHYRINQKVRVISEIHTEVNRLTGIEIIQQRENFCILKVLSESSIKEFDLIFRRIFLLVMDASNDLIQGAKKGDRYLVESMEEKHNTITKFMANGLRLLNKYGHPNHKDTSAYYHVIECLDIINDTLKDSARSIVQEDIKISKLCDSILVKINDSLQDFHKFFYKFDAKLIEKLSSDRFKILDEIVRLSKKLSKEEIKLIMHMKQIIELIYTLKVTRIELEY